ncbi:MAG: hypothetical protein CL902_09045 [Dehalococcoidia bacterium]|nr:hypothetical protein [Dehalococcoidia bacterium]
MVLALLLGIPMTLVSLPMGQSERDPSLVVLGVLIPFFLWGAVILWTYRRLLRKSNDLVTEGEIRWAKSINRREFLVRLGTASATIIVVSSGVGGILAQRDRRELNEAIAATADQTIPSDRGPLPNADDPLVPAFGTRPEYTPIEDHYKVFLRTEPTVINID